MKVLSVMLLAGCSSMACAQNEHWADKLEPYKPAAQVSGTVRVYGNNYIPKMVKQWEAAFEKFQPGVKFTDNLPGTEAAVAGLYGNAADVVFVGREGYGPELHGFRAHNEEEFDHHHQDGDDRHDGRPGHHGHPHDGHHEDEFEPLGVEISSGSFDTPHHTFSLEVYVHKGSSVTKLTMEQCARIFGSGDHHHAPIRTWGQLGVTGPQASHAIHVYGYNFDTGMAGYFNRVVLHGSGRWNEDLKDFDNGRDEKGEVINAGVYILQALAKDPDGIAFANVLYANPDVTPVALARTEAGPFVTASRETIWDRTYPITRFTMAYANRAPGEPLRPEVKEFLRFLVSREGMEIVEKDAAYVPINPQVQREQMEKLK